MPDCEPCSHEAGKLRLVPGQPGTSLFSGLETALPRRTLSISAFDPNSVNQRLLLLATFLTLPVAGVVLWMVVPEPEPVAAREPALKRATGPTETSVPLESSLTVMVADRPPADPSNFDWRADDAFSQLQQTAAPAALVPPTAGIAPRFTLLSEAKTATLHEWLRNTPVAPNERARILPAEVLRAASGGLLSADEPRSAASPLVLLVDRSLHDPAAWVEDETPGEAHAELKDRIADQFATEVRRTATNPEAAGETLDKTWTDARAKANWEYQKFFGGTAANRAGISAGRAAVSKQ